MSRLTLIAQVTAIEVEVETEAPPPAKVEKHSKKNEEGAVINKFKVKNPYFGRFLFNTRKSGDDAPGETWHMVVALQHSTEGKT